MALTNALEIFGEAIVSWNKDLDEIIIALRAADVMARRYEEDIYIMQDLSVRRAADVLDDPPLEIVRYKYSRR